MKLELKKIHFWKMLLIALVAMLSSTATFAQQDVEVSGVMKIYDTNKKLPGVIVSLYKGGTLVKKVTTSSS